MNKTCFVICPIGELKSDTRKRSDLILKYIIKAALEPEGYDVKRADELDKPGIITSQVIQHVLEDDLVVADISERNPNVFYEMAIRHAINKPIIILIDENEEIPFDVVVMRTIKINHQDLEIVNKSKLEIVKQLNAITTTDYIETPITIAIDLEAFKNSKNEQKRMLANILNSISTIEDKLKRPESIIPESYFREMIKDSLGSRSTRILLNELLCFLKSLQENDLLDKNSPKYQDINSQLKFLLHLFINTNK